MMTTIRDPYTLQTDNGQNVNVQTANPNRVLTIHGHRIKVRDIPITVALMECGHYLRGIAFQTGDLVHCENHDDANFETYIVNVN